MVYIDKSPQKYIYFHIIDFLSEFAHIGFIALKLISSIRIILSCTSTMNICLDMTETFVTRLIKIFSERIKQKKKSCMNGKHV